MEKPWFALSLSKDRFPEIRQHHRCLEWTAEAYSLWAEAKDVLNAYMLNGTYFLVQAGSNHLGFIVFIDEESHQMGVQFAYILEYPKPSANNWSLIPVPSANKLTQEVIKNTDPQKTIRTRGLLPTSSSSSFLSSNWEDPSEQNKRKIEGFYQDLETWIEDGAIPWIAFPHSNPRFLTTADWKALDANKYICPTINSNTLEIWAPTHEAQTSIGFISIEIRYNSHEILDATLEPVEAEYPGQMYRKVY